MTERVLARIWIGGRLQRGQSQKLVLAVREANVTIGAPGLEHIFCEPMSIEGLLVSIDEGVLHLQDDRAPDGKIPLLTRTCRELSLTYRHWHWATLDDGCRIEVWEPGMKRPLHFHGDPLDPHAELIEALPIRLAITHLRAGRVERALTVLDRACPEVPDIPLLELIER